MVGGVVIETIELSDRIWVNVRGRGGESSTTCAVYVAKSAKARCVSEGDSLWWQGGLALWTPACLRGPMKAGMKAGKDYDIRLDRIGYSGVSRPKTAKHD